MKNNLILILFIGFFHPLCYSQNGNAKPTQNKTPTLENTKWECKIADGCINKYEFINKVSFRFYSCEMRDSLFGDYFFKGDTLMLDEKGSIYDKELPIESIHRVGRRIYTVVINNNNFKHISMSEWRNGKFEKSTLKFDDNYIYKKK